MHVCMYICTYIHMYICMYVCMPMIYKRMTQDTITLSANASCQDTTQDFVQSKA